MRMIDIIEKKKNGKALDREEIDFFINNYVSGNIPDYQVSALLMAIYFQKMDYEETLALTLAMADSGDRLNLSAIKGVKVDKHSTGGVGDKTSLVLAPMVAALGGKVAKMSGRGLGHTGGTIDKLESIPGFNTALSEEAFIKQVNDIGIAITGQTGNLAPADKKLYALRDVTATVDNISLIASSIMSKKLASGADAIVLDVKTGSGAFMKKEEDAKRLAEEMVRIGKGAGRKMAAMITDMDQPLGFAVGNSLEVIEAINTLKGNGPKDLTELCLNLGTYMILAARDDLDKESAEKELMRVIKDGSALKKLAELVEAQGGNPDAVYDTGMLKVAENVTNVVAKESGYIKSIQSEQIGKASMILGGGRATKEDVIDLSVGVVLSKKKGDMVEKGETIATIYSNNADKAKEAECTVLDAYTIVPEYIEKDKLIKLIIE
ncbi:MAG: pyrimidine-nucleoside phosphorylase [Lachnospira sp.]|nr:pyrimidine-nucleoside phosphorylase [Lachnospira sp.]